MYSKSFTDEEIKNKIQEFNDYADELACVLTDKFLTLGYEFFKIDIKVVNDKNTNNKMDNWLVVKINNFIVDKKFLNFYHFNKTDKQIIYNTLNSKIFGKYNNANKKLIKESLFLSNEEFEKLPEQTKQLLFKFANIVNDKDEEIEIWKN